MASEKFIPPSPEELDALLPALDIKALHRKDKKGAVYHAFDKSLDRQVAVKLISKKISGAPNFLEHFKTQLDLIDRLEHDNIVSVHDYGIIDEMAYVVSDYIIGNPLSRSTKGKAIDNELAARLMIEIAQGLSYAHEQGVVHTDIKPQKILLTPETKPLLVNFGSYCQIRAVNGKPDFGSPGYAAKETLSGKCDFRSDIYSLGVVFYQLLTGTLPKLPYQNPSELSPSDLNFDQILHKALHSNPAQRQSSADEFANEISQALNSAQHAPPQVAQVVGTATTPVTVSLIPASQALPGTIPTTTKVVISEEKPYNLLLGSVVVGVVVAAGALLYAMTQSSSPKKERLTVASASYGNLVIDEEKTVQEPEPEYRPDIPEPSEAIILTASSTDKEPAQTSQHSDTHPHLGTWLKRGGWIREIRFYGDNTCMQLPSSVVGSWKVQDDVINIIWDES